MTYQFQPLALTTRERVDGLTCSQIAEADILQKFQTAQRVSPVTRLRQTVEERDDFIDGRVQEIRDAPSDVSSFGFWVSG
jgi:hypothetical protein